MRPVSHFCSTTSLSARRLGGDAVGADDARLEQRALVAFAAAFDGGVDGTEDVLWQYVGEKTQAAPVDADQGHATMRDQSGRIEQGSITADRDDQVRVFGDLILREPLDEVVRCDRGGRIPAKARGRRAS